MEQSDSYPLRNNSTVISGAYSQESTHKIASESMASYGRVPQINYTLGNVFFCFFYSPDTHFQWISPCSGGV